MNLNFRQIASKLSPMGWITVGGAALGGLVFLIIVFSMASSPSYATLVAGVSPAQTGKITSALSTAGITYQLQNNGTAVGVPSAQEAQARVVLGGQGLLSGANSSQSLESLLGNQSLGQSSLQAHEQQISALEQQLQQQIQNMNGINTAQVLLAIPDPASNLFNATNTKPSASVLLNTTGALDSSTVKAIASQVAGAVTGLSTDKVTVTDQNGDLLWPNTTGANGTSASSRQAAQQAYDQQMSTKAESMLESTLGPGLAVVQVSANLDANQKTQDSVSYGKKGTVLTTNKSTETLTGTGAGTTPGAAGNTATQTAAYAGSSSGNSNYSNKTLQNTYGVGKTVTHEVIPPGAVTSQTISVLLSSKVPKADIPAIQSAVENSVGYVASRDKISVGTIPFAKTAAAPAASSAPTQKMIGYVKYVGIGLGALVFLFFITRMLRRRESEQFAGNPTWLKELENPRPLAALDPNPQMVDLEQPAVVARLRPPMNLARQQVEDLVDRDPERVASQVRQWMNED